MKQQFSKKKIIIWGFLILAAILTLVIVQSQKTSIHWVNENPAGDISIRPIIEFQLSGSIIPSQIESIWFTIPQAAGQWVWQDKQWALWMANAPLEADTPFQFGFDPDLADEAVSSLTKQISWFATTREPSILLLYPDEKTSIISLLNPENPDVDSQIVDVPGEILDIFPAADGEWIFFTLRNESEGTNIRRISRSGNENELLVDCGNSTCILPDQPQNRKDIYFLLLEATSGKGAIFPEEGVYRIDLLTGDVDLLKATSPKEADDFSVSPDGRWLSIYFGDETGIELQDMLSDAVISLTDASSAGSWAWDGNAFYYQRTIRENVFLRYQIIKIDLAIGQSAIAEEEITDSRDYHYFNPAANPINDQIAVTVQSNLNLPGRELWIISPDGDILEKISTDMTRIITGFEWSPDGERLLFRFLNFPPEEGIAYFGNWNEENGTQILAVKNQSKAVWLP